MAEIGQYNSLKIVKEVEFGLYLKSDDYGEILLPKRYVPKNWALDEEISVFVYLDSEDRIIATTEKPLALVNEFAFLEVESITSVGAFLNWGLPKDLLLPFREQKKSLNTGQKVVVFVYLDAESKRLVASAKLEKFLDNVPPQYQPNQEVDILICNQTEIGFKAIINNMHSGMLYTNEVFKKISVGTRTKAYIKKLRSDNKIDLILYKPGYEKIDEMSATILNYIKENNGSMSLNDKSSAEEINKVFGISKKSFKKALGNLYKEKLISISEKGVSMNL